MNEIIVTTYSPRAHIQVCYLIKMHNSEIVHSEFSKDDEFYGNFIIKTPINSIDHFIMVTDTLVEIID